MYIIGLLIFCAILFFENNKLQKELFELKKEKMTKYCPECGTARNNSNVCSCCGKRFDENLGGSFNNSNNLNNAFAGKNISNTVSYENNTIIKTTPDKVNFENSSLVKTSHLDVKNNLILITGAILIVFAAILFLVSTWASSANFLKTFVLVFMLLVFFGASFVAEKYLHLKVTSKAFLYIALSYIPIIFLSVGLFGLFGDYFSFNGAGRYLYLLFSSLLISFIYFYALKKIKSVFVGGLSVIFQILSSISLGLVFTNDINIILGITFLYSFVLNLLYLKKVYYFQERFHYRVSNLLTLCLCWAVVFLGRVYFIHLNYSTVVLEIIMLLNLYLSLVKINNLKDLFNVLCPMFIIAISLEMPTLVHNNSFILYQMFVISGVFVIYLVDMIRFRKVSSISFCIVSFVFFLTYIATIICTLFKQTGFIDSYIVLFVYLVLSVVRYGLMSKHDTFTAYVISFVSALTIFDFTIFNDFIICIPILYLCLFIFNKFIIHYDFKKAYLFSSVLFMIIGFICTMFKFSNNYLLLLIYGLLYVFAYFFGNQKRFKVISYLFINVSMYYLFEMMGISDFCYTVLVSSVIVILLDLFTKTNDKDLELFVIFQCAFSLFVSISLNNIFQFILYIILNVMLVYYVRRNKLSEDLYYIPFITGSFVIAYNELFLIDGFNYMMIVSMLVIAFFMFYISHNSSYDRYTVMGIISIIVNIIFLSYSKYVSLILVLVCGLVLYFSKDKYKDFIKGFIYFLIVTLFEFLVYDFKLYDISVLAVGPYLILLLVLSRTIINKYSADYKVVEYFFSIIINFAALFGYSSEVDGMIYILFLVGLVVICYNKKYGPILLTSLGFIILNVVILTREFWFNVPWWAYMLCVGTILVVFAVRNEISNKNNKFEELKEKLDL